MNLSKLLILAGVLFIGAGLLIHFYGRIPYFGRLPGDIRIERESFHFYFPITSAILVSFLLSLLLSFIRKLKG